MLITCSVSSSELTTDMFGSSEVPALVEPRVPVGGWKINRYTQISSMIQIVVSAVKQFCRMILGWLVEGGHV